MSTRNILLHICLAIAILLTIATMPSAYAASEDALNAANALYELGLFRGTDTDVSDNPNFELDRTPTRHEAVTMLVRLLGKESEAESGAWDTPFVDVAGWASPYVGYAYTNGLTSGTSATTYGGNQIITASQYITFVLRALGYESGTDFQWDRAWELSDKLTITNGDYQDNPRFTRGDVALISYRALFVAKKESRNSILGKPISSKYPDYQAVKQGKILNIIPFSSGSAYILGIDEFGDHKSPYIDALGENGFIRGSLFCSIAGTDKGSEEFINYATGERVYYHYDIVDDKIIVYISCGRNIGKTDIDAVLQKYTAAKDVPVRQLAIECDNAFIGPGEEIHLTAKVTPSNATSALTWETDRPECTSVDSGVVRMFAAGNGSAKITVTSSNGVSAYTYVFLTKSKNKQDVKDADGLRYYLQTKYKNLETPVGNLILSLTMNISQKYSDDPLFAHVSVDFRSEDFAPNNNSLGIAQWVTPLNFTGVGYSREDERAAYEMIRELQQEIYQDIIDCFPDAQASGNIQVSGYRYQYIHVGYWRETTLSWNNFSGTFQWMPDADTFNIMSASTE